MAERPTFQKQRNQLRQIESQQFQGIGAWADTKLQLADTIGQIGDKIQADKQKKNTEQARIEGSQAGVKVDENGAPLFEMRDGSTISGKAFNDAAQRTYGLSLQTKARERMAEISQQFQDDPEQLKGAFDAYKKGVLKDVYKAAPQYAGLAEASLNGMTQSYEQKAIANHTQKIKDNNVEAIHSYAESTFDEALNDIENLPPSQSLQKVAQLRTMLERSLLSNVDKEAINTDVLKSISPELAKEFNLENADTNRTGYLSAAKVDKLLAKFDFETSKAMAMHGLSAAIKNDTGAEYIKEFLATKQTKNIDGQLVGLDEADRRKISRSMASEFSRSKTLDKVINAEADAQARKEISLQASNLEIATNSGKTSKEEIDVAFDEGVISGSKRTQLYAKLDAISARAVSSEKAIIDVSVAIDSGQPLDYKDKNNQRGVDKYFKETIGTFPMDSAEAQQTATHIAASTGIVPQTAAAYIRTNIASQDFEQAAQAADFASRMREDAPQAYARLPQNERAFSLQVSELINAGMGKEDAVLTARKNVYETTDEEKNILSSQFNNTDFREESNSFLLDNVDDKWSGGFFSSSPSVPNEMEAEFNILTKSYFARTRDADQARQLAFDDLGKTWGVTELGGNKRMMKYSPERIYGDGSASDWMQNQLDSKASEYGIKDVQIISDATTARESRPSYVMYHNDEFGNPILVMDKNGEVVRFTPDYSSSNEAKKARKETEKRFNSASAKQRALVQGKSKEFNPRSTSNIDVRGILAGN